MGIIAEKNTIVWRCCIVKKKSSGMLGKLGGLLGGVSSIDFAGDIIKEAAPMIEKSLDRRYEKKQSLVQLPNVIDIDVDKASSIIEDTGFKVVTLQAKPNVRYANNKNNEVVMTEPKAGPVDPGSLVKVYYVTEEVIEESNKLKLEQALKVEDLLNTAQAVKKAATSTFMSYINKEDL